MSRVALGVAGGTGSGKTTVARAILDAVGAERIAFLTQDNYYRDIAWSGPAEIATHNFDHPSALDNELLCRQLRSSRRGARSSCRSTTSSITGAGRAPSGSTRSR